MHHTKNVWEKHVSRIVIGSGAEGSFSLAVRRRASDGEKWETPYHGKWKRRVSRIVIPSEVEGSFSLVVRRSVFDSEERETPYRGKAGAVLPVNGLAKKSGKKGTKKISRCARNDSVGNGYPVHHTKNVWKKHVSRIVIGSEVEGSFSLAVRRRVSDGEKWETPYHGKWKRRVSRIVIGSEVEGSFSLAVRRRASDGEKRETPCRGKAGAVLPVNGLAKKSGKKGTKKISRCARNDSVGDGYLVHHTKNVWEKHVPRIVIGSEVEGSFSLAVRRRVFEKEKWETPYRRKVDGVSRKRLSEGVVGKGGRKRFLAALEMTAWGMAIPCIIQRMCGKSTFPVSSSRAESRDLFR